MNVSKKRVLIVEDQGTMYDALRNGVINVGHEVISAVQISEANYRFNNEDPHFMILDCDVIPVGLTSEEINESQTGRISGWIWLVNYILPKHPGWKSKVIVYSKFTHLLHKYDKEYKNKGILILSKKEYEISDVIKNTVKMIQKNEKLSR